MKPDSSKKSWRRFRKINLKPVDKKARKLEKASFRHAHKFVVSRWANLRFIRRHVVGWLILVALLCGLAALQITLSYRSVMYESQADGGVYAEGMVDSFRTLDPLFATTQAELSANKLIFSGLVRYDEKGYLQPDLATDWKIEEKGKKYTVSLRKDVTWHDGKPFTAKDVLFTIKTIQNPATNAVMYQSWKGVSVSSPDEYTVVFELPNAYAPFASLMTTAMLPRHLLVSVNPAGLQESSFGTQPIGTGPFSFSSLKTLDASTGKTLLQLDAFRHYWQGAPLLSRFSLTAYGTDTELIKAFRSHEIIAANDLSVDDMTEIQKGSTNFSSAAPTVNNGVYAFLKTDSLLLKDALVRKALVQATDTNSVQKELLGRHLAGPVINTRLAASQEVRQAGHDKKQADTLLAQAGYVKNKKGLLQKNNQVLELKVVSVDTPSYHRIIDLLAKQWKQHGVVVRKQFIDPEQIQQSVLRTRDYDVLVYELEIGGDPDTYAYWHSTQATSEGLNFSNYASSLASDALVAARTRSDWEVRDTRYTSFAKQWVADAPAVALYQPTLQYITAGQVKSVTSDQQLPSLVDRYSNVINWSVENTARYKTP